MNVIETVMSRPELRDRPPVLVDIGASGSLHDHWKIISPYSICIAFDADAREFDVNQNRQKFLRLTTFNNIITDSSASEAKFYLTRSPFCSSLLEPNYKSLSNWAFDELFEVERVATLPAIDLQTAMKEADVDHIDWFKTDSQGTDLRLFNSLGSNTIKRVLVAEFEPGIVDVYLDEDKFWHILSYMEDKPFWMDHINIRGSHRIRSDISSQLKPIVARLLNWFLVKSPGWVETSFIHNIDQNLAIREYFLLWVFATLKYQHGFAAEVAQIGLNKFEDPLFEILRTQSIKSINRLGLRSLRAAGRAVVRRLQNITIAYK